MKFHSDHSTTAKESQGKIIHLPEVDSTNDWVKRQIELFFGCDWLAVRADAQTKGRGRLDRVWSSPASQNIYATYLFFLPRERTDSGTFSLVMAVALIELLVAYGIEARIKWPNDVEVNGCKIAGILTETVEWDDKRAVICGIGLNVNMDKEKLVALNRPATAMQEVLGCQVDLESIFLELTNRFIAFHSQFIQEGFSPFFGRFVHAFSLKQGEPIRLSDGKKTILGTYQQMFQDGSIGVLQEGRLVRCYSGEIH